MKFLLLLAVWGFLLSGSEASYVPYDYSASIECLEKPLKPQYNGGIILNPEFIYGSLGWSRLGDIKADVRDIQGNQFVVARHRNQSYGSVFQKLYLKKDLIYTFSAWLQVSDGEAPVTASFKTKNGYRHAGVIIAESRCWSMLKGGISVEESGPTELYFDSKDTTMEIWVDSISLQPFTKEEWRSHHNQSIQKIRKGTVRMKAVDMEGKPVPNAKISIQQNRLNFPFGCEVVSNIIDNQAYQNWFMERFTVTTFANEMKWYSTEPERGKEDYSIADKMLNIFKEKGISVRGHNVLWEDPKYISQWVHSLSGNELYEAVKKRITSVVSRYRGQVIAWDVLNENLHYSFFEDRLSDPNIDGTIYQLVHAEDTSVTLFMNEYNTLEEPSDQEASPARYLKKLREIQSSKGEKGNLPMGIGLESHFKVPNLAYMRSTLDTFAATGLPIWLTEIDVQNSPDLQAKYLEEILREGHAHPKVNGMVLWAGWDPNGCYHMCLTDGNFKNLPTGDVVDKLIREWGGLSSQTAGATDKDGFFETSLFHGDYEVKISNPRINVTTSHAFKLDSDILETTNSNVSSQLVFHV